jgi:hypothetical protein
MKKKQNEIEFITLDTNFEAPLWYSGLIIVFSGRKTDIH